MADPDPANSDSIDWLARVAAINRQKQSDRRAPHKPLLLLHALAQLHADRVSHLRYEDYEPKMRVWLDEFGPARPNQKPEHPFWRLQKDEGLWKVEGTAPIVFPNVPLARILRERQAVGSFTHEFQDALLKDPTLMLDVARLLLVSNWPESLHDEICASVGLDVEAIESGLARRRVRGLEAAVRPVPGFRKKVLQAYGARCAMCGFKGRLGSASVGLAATHIRWWSQQGPDITQNALCLCVLHGHLFDRGAISVAKDRTIMVAPEFRGRDLAAEVMVGALGGRPIAAPRSKDDEIDEEHRSWHEREVFRAPARWPDQSPP